MATAVALTNDSEERDWPHLRGRTKASLREHLADKRDELERRLGEMEDILAEIDATEHALRLRRSAAEIRDEQIRDAIVELGEFTYKELAKAANVSLSAVKTRLPKFIESGMVRQTNRYKQLTVGTPAFVFEYVPPTHAGPGNPPAPTDADLLEKVRRSARLPVSLVTRPHVGDSDVDALLERAHSQGFRMRKSKKTQHVLVFAKDPGMKPVSLPHTSSDHRNLMNKRAELRNIGVEIP